jgi:2'-5' RNA ligase
MNKKAVDIVLLPDEAVTQVAIDANAKLVAEFGDEIVLNKDTCLPHISLAMGCIDETDIGEVEIILRTIAEDTPALILRTAGVAISTNAKGQSVSVIVIARDKKLLSLHNEVMNRLESYMDSNVTADMIYPSGEIAESTLMWIRHYRTNSAFAKFLPHITLGYGRLDEFSFPAEFYPSKLALCHLGNHCTCRKILAAVDL